ncbi:MAG: hypothetical protein KGY76_09860, partial [Candidatus Thermoplasmatota archaeon]|nr:hypothetical protein [Candidatus Thermoplasmatota archaeon]
MKVKISYKGWIKSSWTKAIVLIVSLLLVVNVSSVVQSLDFEDGYRHHADETEVEMSIEETKDTRKNDEDSQETAALGDSPDKSKRENPSPTAYDIYDWNDLNDVRNDLSGTYYLQNDLDSNMSDYGGIGDNWDPIGDFEGTFDGQGYTIESLVVDSSSPGLFGYGTVGTIKNLGLRNVDISGDTAGSLVGTLDSGGLVKQCWVNGGTVDGVNSWDAGGLVGFNYGDVKDCYVRGMGAVKNADNIGGLVGSNGDSGTYGGLENTYAANFSTFWANTYLGTVIGVNWQGGEAYESSTGSLDTWSDPIGDDLGISSGIDGGLPTSTMQSYSHFNNKGWDITSVSSTYDRDTSYTWNIVDGSSYPFLSIKDVPNRAPDALSNPSPSDGATGVRTNPTLEVDVSDPDGDDMDVSFYDASNDNLIGTDSSVSSGSTASVTWSGLTSGTTYSWYAVADDGEETTKSDTWSFTTNAPPTVDLTRPDGGEHLMAADTETIWWNMSDEDVNSDLTVDLYYSKDNGSNWNTITTGIAGTANPNSYDWTVPNVQSSDCLVKAEVTDTVGSSSTDQSAGVFTIDAYKLTINSTIGGEVTVPGEGDFDHGAGESVTLEAVPDPDYHFKRWSGENDTISDPTSNQTTITVQENHNITAEFIQKGYDLTLSSTIGGSITRPGEDTFTYNASEVVDIEAEPDEHYHFVRWSGDNDTVGDPAVNSTTIEMLDHYEITARFALDVYELNLNVEGEGNISPEQGSHSYEYGEKVTIETQPDDNWTFSHWTGDIPESDEEKSEITITMEGDRSLTAHFVRKAYFDVTIDSPEEGEEYLVGDEVLVNYTITNLGEIEDTQMIVFSVYDEQEDLVYEDYEEVTLGDPEKAGSDGVYGGEFTWVIYEGRIGNFDLVVKSEDAEKEVGIKVKEI